MSTSNKTCSFWEFEQNKWRDTYYSSVCFDTCMSHMTCDRHLNHIPWIGMASVYMLLLCLSELLSLRILVTCFFTFIRFASECVLFFTCLTEFSVHDITAKMLYVCLAIRNALKIVIVWMLWSDTECLSLLFFLRRKQNKNRSIYPNTKAINIW